MASRAKAKTSWSRAGEAPPLGIALTPSPPPTATEEASHCMSPSGTAGFSSSGALVPTCSALLNLPHAPIWELQVSGWGRAYSRLKFWGAREWVRVRYGPKEPRFHKGIILELHLHSNPLPRTPTKRLRAQVSWLWLTPQA